MRFQVLGKSSAVAVSVATVAAVVAAAAAAAAVVVVAHLADGDGFRCAKADDFPDSRIIGG